jgi:predicted ATPase
MARPGEIVILEQPELHLHPSMQIRLAEFLLACVKSGRQVIVETHSEYLVNRLRRHAVEEPESSELVKLVFAEQDSKGVTQFRESAIDSDGGLSEDWPSGFLDVASDEAFRLLSAHLDKDPTN